MQDKPIHIDLQAIIRQRLGCWSRCVPRPLVRWLERTICQDKLNWLLEHNFPRRGADFSDGVLADLDVTVDVENAHLLPDPADRRVVIVSNHPLGGLDGMALISWATRFWGGKVHFVVNDLLNAIEPLQPVFLPINKLGRQDRANIRAIDEAFAGDDPVIVFPAGLCSRQGSDGRVADLEWQKMFVNKAIESQRRVVPVFFSGQNSPFFYRLARRRKRLGLKFNIEMLYLPREVFRAAGSRFTIYCGRCIDWQSLRGGSRAKAQAAEVRSLVYNLAPNDPVK